MKELFASLAPGFWFQILPDNVTDHDIICLGMDTKWSHLQPLLLEGGYIWLSSQFSVSKFEINAAMFKSLCNGDISFPDPSTRLQTNTTYRKKVKHAATAAKEISRPVCLLVSIFASGHPNIETPNCR